MSFLSSLLHYFKPSAVISATFSLWSHICGFPPVSPSLIWERLCVQDVFFPLFFIFLISPSHPFLTLGMLISWWQMLSIMPTLSILVPKHSPMQSTKKFLSPNPCSEYTTLSTYEYLNPGGYCELLFFLFCKTYLTWLTWMVVKEMHIRG